MTIDERADGTVLVSYDSLGLTRVMLGATVLLLAVAGYDILVGARGTERLVGLLGAAATCLLVGIVFLERARFQFAPAAVSSHGVAAGRCGNVLGQSRSTQFSPYSLNGRLATTARRAGESCCRQSPAEIFP